MYRRVPNLQRSEFLYALQRKWNVSNVTDKVIYLLVLWTQEKSHVQTTVVIYQKKFGKSFEFYLIAFLKLESRKIFVCTYYVKLYLAIFMALFYEPIKQKKIRLIVF